MAAPSWKSFELPAVRYDLVRLEGGLDLVTPPLSLKPGVLRDAVNYEASVTGGYTRIAGYERYDGRPNPSDAALNGLSVSSVAGLTVGATFNGQTSGATGVVVAIDDLAVYYTKATGSFISGENVRLGVTVFGVVTALGSLLNSTLQQAQYQLLAANSYRADIGAVPGAGPVRGVSFYKGKVYAWRNNVGNTALVMYVASSAGWTAVPLGVELAFNTGLAAGIVDGNTVTGLSSGATGVVSRVVVRTGSFGAGTAAGSLIFASVTGTFTAGEALRVAGTTRANAVAAQSAITLQPNGRVETEIGNFGGVGLSGSKMYGCDGVNRGFEFDGTVYVPIVTGMAQDAPTRVAVHKLHLFFAFGASVQFSGLGLPYSWSVVLGAGEIALDDVCSNFAVQPGAQDTGAMAIYTRSSTFMLYGTSSANWNLVIYNTGTGALPYSSQTLSQTYVLDDRGVIQLATSLNYGNFTDATLTNQIRPFIQTRRNRTTASCVNREKSQYRVFFSDGYGLYLTVVNGRFRGAMPVFFPNPVTCCVSGETPDGTETSFFGSTDGFVYRLDAGPNFDGAQISATATLAFNAEGNSRVLKRYRKGSLEISGASYAEIQVGYNLAYGDALVVDQGAGISYANNFSAPLWDSFTWDAFIWDGLSLTPSEIEVTGTAENIAIRIDSNSAISEPFTLNSFILHYSARRGLR